MSLFDKRGCWERWNTRTTTAELLRFDLAPFAKQVDLAKAAWGGWAWTWTNGHKDAITYTVLPDQGVRLQHTQNTNDHYAYTVWTVTTPCHYGGVRWWWLCPACGRRCRVLYLQRVFVCWQCSGAYYASQQNDAPFERIERAMARIRRRLQGQRGEVLPDCPKGMHFRTYMRLGQRLLDLEHARLNTFAVIDWAKVDARLAQLRRRGG